MISKNETWPIVLLFAVLIACRVILEWSFLASAGTAVAVTFVAYLLVWRKRERER